MHTAGCPSKVVGCVRKELCLTIFCIQIKPERESEHCSGTEEDLYISAYFQHETSGPFKYKTGSSN